MPYNNGNGNSNGRNYSQFDVNTNSLSVFSGNMCMRLDLYNKNLQVGLIRAVQTSEGRNTYPKDNAIRALLTPDRVQAVVTLITDGVIPALEARRPYEGSIITNSKMSTIVRVGCDADGNAYFDIYTGMDDRRIPKDAARYQFPKNQTLSRFDAKTGEYEQGPDVQGQLYLVARCMEDFIYNSSMAAVHSYRIVENSYNRRIMNLLQDIAAKMGIPVQRVSSEGNSNGGYRYGGNGNSNNGGGFANSSVMNSPIPEANVTTLDNIDSPELPF